MKRITKTFERKTHKNHYKRFFAESADGTALWWVDTNKGEITGARKRVYTNVEEEISVEGPIMISEIPPEVVEFIKDAWKC